MAALSPRARLGRGKTGAVSSPWPTNRARYAVGDSGTLDNTDTGGQGGQANMRAGGQQARQGANLEILPQLGPRDGPGRVTSACDKQQSQPAKGGGATQPGNSANKDTRGQLSSMYRSRATNMKGGPRGALPRRARCRRAPPRVPRVRHHDGRAVYSKQQLGGGHDEPERKPRADLVVSPFWPARTPLRQALEATQRAPAYLSHNMCRFSLYPLARSLVITEPPSHPQNPL